MSELVVNHLKEREHYWRCSNCESIIRAKESEFEKIHEKFLYFFKTTKLQMTCLACNKLSSFSNCDGWGQM